MNRCLKLLSVVCLTILVITTSLRAGDIHSAAAGDLNRVRVPVILTSTFIAGATAGQVDGKYFGEVLPASGAKLFAPGFASTQHHDDMSPVYSPNGREVILRILGKREGKTIGLLYITRMNDAGEWSTPQPLPFLTRKHMNGSASFTPDGSRIYFTSRRPLPGEEETEARARIWYASRTGEGWGDATLVETPINQLNINSGFFLAADGTMYASFNAPGKENPDIYELKEVDGNYPEYHLLPGAVNSPDTEASPFVNREKGYLLYTFASKNGMSVKISYLENDGKWSEPEVVDELTRLEAKFVRISPDGKYLFFVSHKQMDQSNPRATWPIDDFDAPALKYNADIYWMDARFISDRVRAYKEKRLAQDTLKFTDLYGDYLGQKPPGDTPVVFARGIIATEDLEHSPAVFTPDGNEVYWITARPPGPGNSDWINREMTMRRIRNRWTVPMVSPYKGMLVFSPDGHRGYFWSDNDRDIFVIEKHGGDWSQPRCLNIIKQYPDLKLAVDPSVTKNGSLYFMGIAEGLGMRHDYAIYRMKLINGKYAKPELLPRSINLPGFQSWTPFVAPDESYLIFSSDRSGQFGGGDLYISFHDINADVWSESVNMGEKVNSRTQERLPGVSPDGKYLFFTRWIPGRHDDIHWVSAEIIEKLKAKVIQEQHLNIDTPKEGAK